MKTKGDNFNSIIEKQFNVFIKTVLKNKMCTIIKNELRYQKRHISLESVTSKTLANSLENNEIQIPYKHYSINGVIIPIFDDDLGNAISLLPPKSQTIILMCF